MPPTVATEVREPVEGVGCAGGLAVAQDAEAKLEGTDRAAEVPREEVKPVEPKAEEVPPREAKEVSGGKDAVNEEAKEDTDAKEAPSEALPQEADSWLCSGSLTFLRSTHNMRVVVLRSSPVLIWLLLELRMLGCLKKKSIRR